MNLLSGHAPPSPTDLDHMHQVYIEGGRARQMAPHIVYPDANCPHPGCRWQVQAIDFRLEDHGKDVHDRLVRAWWNDIGFAGRCPECHGWIHFTIKGKRALSESEAGNLPNLPHDWHKHATIL